MPQLLKPACLEPVLHNKRSHHNEKPLLAATRESPRSNEEPTQPKKKKKKLNLKKKKQASVFKVKRIKMWGGVGGLSSVLHQTLDVILILGSNIKLLLAAVIFLIPQLLLYSFPNFYLF